MQDEQARFQEEVRQCAEEIGQSLAALTTRHSPLAVLAALVEHIGVGLFVCHASGACTRQRVREILRRVEELTFASSTPGSP